MNDNTKSELEVLLETRDAQGKIGLHLALELAEQRVMLEQILTLQARTLDALGQTGETGDLAAEIQKEMEDRMSRALDDLLKGVQRHLAASRKTPNPASDTTK